MLTGLFLRTVLITVLISLPCLAGCAFALRRGFRDYTLVGLTGLAAIGVTGYVSFWLWFLTPVAGFPFSLLLPIASAWYIFASVGKLDIAGRTLLKKMLLPLGLTASAALLILATGFLYGGWDSVFETEATRFTHPLPGDNQLPYIFAESAARGHIQKMIMGDWHSSDRPPLQTGIFLSVFPYARGQRSYAVLGSLAQSLWIFALWMCLRAFPLQRNIARLALAVPLLSGFVFINTFYVWPKLIAAAYMLGFLVILVSGRIRVHLRNDAFIAVVAGALLAFGLLAHGGSAFALLGFIATMLVMRKPVPLKSVVVIAATLFILYLPWTMYQKFFDPPGDRLLKIHIAGVDNPDARSFARVLIASYRTTPPQQILQNKLENLKPVIDHNGDYWARMGQLAKHLLPRSADDLRAENETAAIIRGINFFWFAPSLGSLILGVPALLGGLRLRGRSEEWKLAGAIWLYIAITVVIWCVVMFGPGTTIIHSGTYVTVLLAYVGSLFALWALQHWLAYVIAALQIALNFVLYVVYEKPSSTIVPHVHYNMLLLCVVGLVSVLFHIRAFGTGDVPDDVPWRAPSDLAPANTPLSNNE